MRRLSTITGVALVVASCAAPSGRSTSHSTPAAPTPAATTPAATPPTPTPSPTPSAAIIAIIPTANGPIELAASGDTVWVENHRSDFLSRIDPAQNLEVERLTEVNVHCEVTVGAGFVWTTQASASSANKVDPATGAVVEPISQASACGVAADDDDVWISSPGLGTVVRYDPQTLEVRASIDVAPMVFMIAIGSDAVWVAGEADGGTVYRIDPATNSVVASISTPNPFATGIAVGHGAVWVPGRENKVVYRIDPATNEVVATIQMPSAVGGLGVGSDAIWTSGFGDGNVYKLDPATNEIVGSVPTGQGNLGPPLAAFGSIWVAALDRNVVVRIDPAAISDSN
jgi:streptogramin lyase